MKMVGRGTQKGVYYQIEIPLRIPLLLHQKERWKTPAGPRLPKVERTNHTRHLPLTPDPRPNTTNRRCLGIHQVRRPMGVQ